MSIINSSIQSCETDNELQLIWQRKVVPRYGNKGRFAKLNWNGRTLFTFWMTGVVFIQTLIQRKDLHNLYLILKFRKFIYFIIKIIYLSKSYLLMYFKNKRSGKAKLGQVFWLTFWYITCLPTPFWDVKDFIGYIVLLHILLILYIQSYIYMYKQLGIVWWPPYILNFCCL